MSVIVEIQWFRGFNTTPSTPPFDALYLDIGENFKFSQVISMTYKGVRPKSPFSQTPLKSHYITGDHGKSWHLL